MPTPPEGRATPRTSSQGSHSSSRVTGLGDLAGPSAGGRAGAADDLERLTASSFRSVPDMWHHRVGSTPDAEAMIHREGSRWVTLTWRDAAARVERIANALLAAGLQPEQRCCIIAETSVDWILADLAILCAGGATTTIYPTSTAEECAYIIGDCEAAFVFCDTPAQVEKLASVRERIGTVGKVVTFGGRASDDGWVTSLPAFEAAGRAWGKEHPEAYREASRAIGPERLATLMYTSGTTGMPKGVMLTHDAWIYEAEAIDTLGFMTPADKHYLFLPLAHVFAKVMEVSFIRLGIPTVVDGATGEELLRNLQETRPTMVAAVPRFFEKAYNAIVLQARARGRVGYATFKWALGIGRQVSALRQEGREPSGVLRARWALADRLVFSKVKARFGGRIRFFISGGAPLSQDIAEFLHACDLLVLEGYGLTESSAASCVNRLEDYAFGTVGPPLPGCRIQIAEDGEILLRSRGVMKGYYRRPEDTAEVLTEDGWLRTGDIGLQLPSGHVRITDRKKELIVTAGGKNIAPAHFQNLLKSRSPYVSEVLVHGDRRPFCVALIAIDEAAVSRWARERSLSYTDYADLAQRPEVEELIRADVDAVNRELPSFEQVKKLALLPEPLTQEGGAITATGKLKRRVVEERYRALLEGFYVGAIERV